MLQFGAAPRFHPNLDTGLNIRVNRITRDRKEEVGGTGEGEGQTTWMGVDSMLQVVVFIIFCRGVFFLGGCKSMRNGETLKMKTVLFSRKVLICFEKQLTYNRFDLDWMFFLPQEIDSEKKKLVEKGELDKVPREQQRNNMEPQTKQRERGSTLRNWKSLQPILKSETTSLNLEMMVSFPESPLNMRSIFMVHCHPFSGSMLVFDGSTNLKYQLCSCQCLTWRQIMFFTLDV